MKEKLLSWLNGALGQREAEDVPTEDRYSPPDGVVRIPKFFEMPADPHGGMYMGPECKVLISVGETIKVGHLLAEIDTPSHIFEVVAPCDGVIQEVYISNGEVVNSGQDVCKIHES